MTPTQLRAARKSLGLSQSGLAERLGIHPQTLSDYERGVREIPKLVEVAVTGFSQTQKSGQPREGLTGS
jgi:transcriptional regulator with XRE-family HTH domain